MCSLILRFLFITFLLFGFITSVKSKSFSTSDTLQSIFVGHWCKILDTTFLSDRDLIDKTKIVSLDNGDYCIFHDFDTKTVAAIFSVYKGELNGELKKYDTDGYIYFQGFFCNNKKDGYSFYYNNKKIFYIELYNHGVFGNEFYRIDEKGRVYQSHKKNHYLIKRKHKIVSKILNGHNLEYESYRKDIGKFKILY